MSNPQGEGINQNVSARGGSAGAGGGGATGDLVRLLKTYPPKSCGIIYTHKREDASGLASLLVRAGVPAAAYHAKVYVLVNKELLSGQPTNATRVCVRVCVCECVCACACVCGH